MRSLISRKFATEIFRWQWHYYFLTQDGIKYLREYLGLPSTVIPNTYNVNQENNDEEQKEEGGEEGGEKRGRGERRGRGRGRGGRGGRGGRRGGKRGGDEEEGGDTVEQPSE